VGGCSEAAVTADSAAASEAAARRLEDMQLERRKAEEVRERERERERESPFPQQQGIASHRTQN
jgi:hypothetical protein